MSYICPRCQGTDVYFAKRQRITGVGGIYGNRAKMLPTALCKACGENMNDIRDGELLTFMDSLKGQVLLLFVCLLVVVGIGYFFPLLRP